MRFKNITIPAEGRNKYGNYMSSSELQKSVIRVTYNGNNTTGGNDIKKPEEEQRDNYTLFLSRSTIKFDSKKLLEGNVTESIDVLGFVNNFTGDTFVGNIDTIPTEDIEIETEEGKVVIPVDNIEKNNDYYDIVGLAEKGMTISVAGNGTKNTQIQITCTSAATENEVRAGTLVVPCSVYKKSGDVSLGPYLTDWASEQDSCYTLYLEIQWEISALPASNAYTLELTNEIAGINCDSKGNIYPNAVRPTCKAIMYYGTEEVANATYSISIDENRNAQGVTINTSTGELTFGSNFTFNGTTLEVTVTGNADGALQSKIMTIVKQYAGEDGTPATTRWVVPSVNAIKYNPDTNTLTPTSVSCKIMKQVGEEAPIEDTSTPIYYGYNTTNPLTQYTGPVSPDKSKDFLVFALKNDKSEIYEIETIQIIKNGAKGDTGTQGEPGRQGPALRGPVDWKNQVTSRRWCNGILTDKEHPDEEHPEDAEFIDIVVYNGTYYKCETSYEGAGSETTAPPSEYWKATDKQYEFVSTNLLLAENAKINFQTSNELYLMDDNGNVTAGAAGGNGISFWAGANEPANGNFKVNYDGSITAKTGTFAGYVQMPYVRTSTLETGNSSSYGTYVLPKDNAYLIVDSGFYGMGDGCFIKIPEPTAALNGFTYHIIAQSNIATKGAAGGYYVVPKDGYNHTITIETVNKSLKLVQNVFYRDIAGKYHTFAFYTGSVVITCIPSFNDSNEYVWCVTQCEDMDCYVNDELIGAYSKVCSDNSVEKIVCVNGQPTDDLNNDHIIYMIK